MMSGTETFGSMVAFSGLATIDRSLRPDPEGCSFWASAGEPAPAHNAARQRLARRLTILQKLFRFMVCSCSSVES